MASRLRQAPENIHRSVVDLGWTGPPEESIPDLTDEARVTADDDAPLPRFPSESVVSFAAPLRALDEQAHENLHLLREAIGVSTPGTMPDAHPDAPTTPLFPAPSVPPPAPLRPDDSMSLRSMPPAPGLWQALGQRVRIAGGEVPLWSLLSPLVVLISLGAAFASAAVSESSETNFDRVGSGAAAAMPTLERRTAEQPAARPSEPKKARSELERVASGEVEAIRKLEAKAPEDVTLAEAFALAEGRSVVEQRAARELLEKLERDPGLIKDTAILKDLRKFSDNAETARDAIRAMASIPGPISADMLYDVWTATAARTPGTELAQSLLYTKDVRAKASRALNVALELRAAEKCEDARALLPTATEFGDKRSWWILAKMTRRYGCGTNKRQDCYECLRSGNELDVAQKAAKSRREPRPFPPKE